MIVGCSIFACTLVTIDAFFAVFVAVTSFFLSLLFVVIVFVSEVGAISNKVVLDSDASGCQLGLLLIGQLALEKGGFLILIELIFTTFLKAVVFEVANEFITVFGHHVEYFETWEHVKDVFSLVLCSFAAWVSFQIEILQVFKASEDGEVAHLANLIVGKFQSSDLLISNQVAQVRALNLIVTELNPVEGVFESWEVLQRLESADVKANHFELSELFEV